jgi:hypothetical protein
VANNHPRTDQIDPYRWRKGQSGNPNGCSQKQRVTRRLLKLIEDGNLEDRLALLWLGAAMGDERLLKGRKPCFAFFKELLDRIEGRLSLPEPEPDIDIDMRP